VLAHAGRRNRIRLTDPLQNHDVSQVPNLPHEGETNRGWGNLGLTLNWR
jgi:hypothetical protein